MSLRHSAVVDEDLPRSFSRLLKELGWHVFDVRDVGLRGKPDDFIFLFALQHKAVLFSGDFGFGNPYRYPITKDSGIVLLAYPNELSSQVMLSMARRALHKMPLKTFLGNLIILEPGRMRIRRIR